MTNTNARPATRKPRVRTVLVYGLDEHNKPRAAQFVGIDVDVAAKAAAAADLGMCPVTSKALKTVAAMLPAANLDTKDLAVIPHIEDRIYRKLFDVLAEMDQSKADPGKTDAVVATGLPETWEQIAPGHLVIAQESLEYGWAEAVVLDRDGETLKLRFRDYPRLPKFTRPVRSVALLNAAVPSQAMQGNPSPQE